jgi:Fic family protein
MTLLLPFQMADVQALCRELDEWRVRLDARATLPRRWDGRLRRDLGAAAIGASVGLEQVPVTVDEVRRILAGDRPTNVSPEDAALVTGYRDAMSYVLRRADDPGFRWDRELVVGLHDRVLAGRYAEGAGRLRSRTATLTDLRTGAEIFRPPADDLVGGLLDEMCAAVESSPAHPAAVSAWIHVACAAIHPFRDGNGRTARVLASLGMYRGGFRRPEFTSLEEWWGRHPGSYYAAFACLGPEFDRDSDVTSFIRTHLEAQLSQVRALDLKERIEGRIWVAVENVALDRGLPERVANALWDAFFGRPVVAGYYREIADVSAPTATNDLTAATAARLLRAEGQRRGRRYLAGPSLVVDVATALGVDVDDQEASAEAVRARIARELAERLVIADQTPEALIAGAWREVEREIEEIALKRGTSAGEASPRPARDQILPDGVAADAAMTEEARSLREARNGVVHGEGLPPTGWEALEYAGRAQRLIDALRREESAQGADSDP